MGDIATEEDIEKLQAGLQKHALTTKEAEQAAKTALAARETARATVTALHEQEVQVKRTLEQYDEVQETVTRAEGILSWFDACCCCKCCVRDVTAAKPSENHTSQLPKSATRPPLPQSMKNARAPSGNGAAERHKKPMRQIGRDLGGPIEEELRIENEKQDAAIDTIDGVLDDLHVAAMDIQSQLKRQAQLEDELVAKNEAVRARVKTVTKHVQQSH